MKGIVRSLALAVAAIGLTFSYSFVTALLPEGFAEQVVVAMSLWSLAVVVGYITFTRLVHHRTWPSSIRLKIGGPGGIVVVVVIGLMGLAILFPSPNHDRLDMVYIVAIAVIGEEMLFRGLLWDLIEGWIGDETIFRLSATIWLTAMAFGLMHLQYHHFEIHRQSVVQVLYTFGVGLVLGMVRQRTRSVVAAIFAHSVFNSVFNLTLALM